MKVLKSSQISAFGGLNFVLEELDRQHIGDLLNNELPDLAPQSRYTWRDIFFSHWSVFFCGGDCVEDLSWNLRPGLSGSPLLNIPSSDRVLCRLKELASPMIVYPTVNGKSTHEFSHPLELNRVNLMILKQLGLLPDADTDVVLDYDNTIIPTKKADVRNTYKKCEGYCPGVAIIGDHVVYVENRNGNSGAQVLQEETLERMFTLLEEQGIFVDAFRSDSASFKLETIAMITQHSKRMYTKAKMSATMFEPVMQITDWKPFSIRNKEIGEIGETNHVPFAITAKKSKREHLLQPFRMVVVKKKREDKQLNMYTQEAYNYEVILTTDWESSMEEVYLFYSQRGAAERQFDILKNDFGWKNLAFSKLEQNAVFLVVTAMCRNIYSYMIQFFSSKVKSLQPHYRIKKFIFRFITIPAKWIRKGRQNVLRIYGDLHFET